jgi:hypothetical protein
MYKRTCRYWSTPQPSGEDSQQDDGELDPEISVHGALLGSEESKSSTRFAAVGWPGGPTLVRSGAAMGRALSDQRSDAVVVTLDSVSLPVVSPIAFGSGVARQQA